MRNEQPFNENWFLNALGYKGLEKEELGEKDTRIAGDTQVPVPNTLGEEETRQ